MGDGVQRKIIFLLANKFVVFPIFLEGEYEEKKIGEWWGIRLNGEMRKFGTEIGYYDDRKNK